MSSGTDDGKIEKKKVANQITQCTQTDAPMNDKQQLHQSSFNQSNDDDNRQEAYLLRMQQQEDAEAWQAEREKYQQTQEALQKQLDEMKELLKQKTEAEEAKDDKANDSMTTSQR